MNNDDFDFKDLFLNMAKVMAFILILVAIFANMGCKSLDILIKPDENLIQGCKGKVSAYKLGVFYQQGGIETCKVKCSKELPKGFYYSYDRNGCKILVSTD